MMIMITTRVLDDAVAGVVIVALVVITVKVAVRGGNVVPVHHDDDMIQFHLQDIKVLVRHHQEGMHHVKKKIRLIRHNAHPDGTQMNMMIRVRYKHRDNIISVIES